MWVRRFFLSVAVLCVASMPATAGNISLEGPTGLFVNPAAEVTPVGRFTPQACWLHKHVAGAGELDGVLAMGSYTFSSKTELGAQVQYLDVDGVDSTTAAGLLVRQMVLEHDGYRPAIAVGGDFLEGSDIEQQMVFAAMKQALTPEDAAAMLYLHLGAKWRWSGSVDDGTGWGGLELVLGDGRWSIIAEYAFESDFELDDVWSFGFQYHGRNGLGLSVAMIDLGDDSDDLAGYFGIGYVFVGD